MGNKPITKENVIEAFHSDSTTAEKKTLSLVKKWCNQFKKRHVEDEREFNLLAAKKEFTSVCEYLMKRCETKEERRRWDDTMLRMIIDMDDYLRMFELAVNSQPDKLNRTRLCNRVLREFRYAHIRETHETKWVRILDDCVGGNGYWKIDHVAIQDLPKGTVMFTQLPPCYRESQLRGRYFRRLLEIFRRGIAKPDRDFLTMAKYHENLHRDCTLSPLFMAKFF